MSGPEKQKPDDSLLEEFLTGDGEVLRVYREQARAVAPPALDEPVLKIARDELGRPVIVQQKNGWGRRLRVPLALAATLVLSLGMMLGIQRDPDARREVLEMALSPPPPPVAASAPAPVALMAIEQAPPLSPQLEAAADVRPEPVEEIRTAEVADASRKRAEDAPAAEVAAAPPPDTQAGAEEAPRLSRRAAAPPAMKQALKQEFAPAPAETSGMASAAMADAAPPTKEPAQAWLARVRSLRDAGRPEEARAELRRFREAYPQRVLLPDLQALDSGAVAPVAQEP